MTILPVDRDPLAGQGNQAVGIQVQSLDFLSDLAALDGNDPYTDIGMRRRERANGLTQTDADASSW